jgi:hypothetical protein
VVFKLCAAAPWGAEGNPKGAAIFFRQFKIFQSIYQNLVDFQLKAAQGYL